MKEPLVLLPGFGATETVWKHQLDHLSDVCSPQIIVFNTEESRASMVQKVLKLAPERFSLVGHSMGGWVAQAVAAQAPSRLSKLILLNTWTRLNLPMITMQEYSCEMIKGNGIEALIDGFVSKLFYSERYSDILLLSTVKTMLRQQPTAVLCRQLVAMNRDYETLPLLKHIAAPTLVIHGREDALFSLEEQKVLGENIANSHCAIIEECGHMSPLERPQAATALIRLWLESSF